MEWVGSNHVESIQGTSRQSLKMGRGDKKKPLMHCIRRLTILISNLQKCHLSQTMVSSNRYVGRLRMACNNHFCKYWLVLKYLCSLHDYRTLDIIQYDFDPEQFNPFVLQEHFLLCTNFRYRRHDHEPVSL